MKKQNYFINLPSLPTVKVWIDGWLRYEVASVVGVV